MVSGRSGRPLVAEPGTYVLHLQLPSRRHLQVGQLGSLRFSAGVYSYVGSARGPGGLAARLGRHLTGSGTLHWHIDHLRRAARPLAVWYARGSALREHEWASALERTAGVVPGPAGFGASDCGCATHLFRWPGPPALKAFATALSSSAGGPILPGSIRILRLAS